MSNTLIRILLVSISAAICNQTLAAEKDSPYTIELKIEDIIEACDDTPCYYYKSQFILPQGKEYPLKWSLIQDIHIPENQAFNIQMITPQESYRLSAKLSKAILDRLSGDLFSDCYDCSDFTRDIIQELWKTPDQLKSQNIKKTVYIDSQFDEISLSNSSFQPGDIAFFYKDGDVVHTALYLGRDYLIAKLGSFGVVITNFKQAAATYDCERIEIWQIR